MTKIIISSILIFLAYTSAGQPYDEAKEKAELLKYKEFDYFNYDYKYLDEEYNIIIPSLIYENTINEFKMNRDVLGKDYGDSIIVVMFTEFENPIQRRIGINRMKFSFLRGSYYLWCTPKEAEMLTNRYNYKHPYLLFDYFWNNDSQWDSFMIDYISNLREKVEESTGSKEVKNMNNKEFLGFALVNNPKRQADFAKIHGGDGKVCGKPDCCQLEGSKREKCESDQH
jgi:hypothetical protein